MAIEVKQMLVKSTVLQKQEAGTQEQSIEAKGRDGDPYQDLEEIKAEILAQCRRLFIEMLRAERER